MIDLAGRRVLVLEDSYMLAMEAKSALEDAGAEVVGPFATTENANRSLWQGKLDCVVLDVNLGGGTSLDLAKNLERQGIPFLFFTGYDRNALPPEFADVDRLEKPVDAVRLVQAVERCCRSGPPRS